MSDIGTVFIGGIVNQRARGDWNYEPNKRKRTNAG